MTILDANGQNQTLEPDNPAHCNHLIDTGGYRAERIWNPKVKLHDSTKETLTKICFANPNEEVCGFLTIKEHIMFVKNIHENPRHNFFMCEHSLKEVIGDIYDTRQSKIMGIFHTHPNNQPWPSPRDIVGWPNSDLRWRYFIVTMREVLEWELVYSNE